ncbi:MAG: DnaB-like helicase C-terminal domain-containing protein, partial [Clostridiales bacterium]|nr:DnaB-like helicase C-terminal domain-containing protein [Clostridiales bacterium]
RNMQQLSATCNYLKQSKLDLVIIDTFQGIMPPLKAMYDARIRAETAVRELETIAQKHTLPLLLLSEIEPAPDKALTKSRRPYLGHLMDHGALQYRAHPIMILHDLTVDEINNAHESNEAAPIKLYIESNLNGGMLRYDLDLTYMRSYGKFENTAKVSDYDVPEG